MSSETKTYRGNVLFVDDTQVNMMLGSKILRQFGLEVKTAENGQEAIEHCKNNTFQLIFMDLEMPELGGLAAAKTIREKKLSYAPIFALTGNDGESIRQLCRAAHMNGFIAKPIKKEKLAEVLAKVFHHE